MSQAPESPEASSSTEPSTRRDTNGIEAPTAGDTWVARMERKHKAHEAQAKREPLRVSRVWGWAIGAIASLMVGLLLRPANVPFWPFIAIASVLVVLGVLYTWETHHETERLREIDEEWARVAIAADYYSTNTTTSTIPPAAGSTTVQGNHNATVGTGNSGNVVMNGGTISNTNLQPRPKDTTNQDQLNEMLVDGKWLNAVEHLEEWDGSSIPFHHQSDHLALCTVSDRLKEVSKAGLMDAEVESAYVLFRCAIKQLVVYVLPANLTPDGDHHQTPNPNVDLDSAVRAVSAAAKAVLATYKTLSTAITENT